MHPASGGLGKSQSPWLQLLPCSGVPETWYRISFCSDRGLRLLARQKISLMLAAAISAGLSEDEHFRSFYGG